MYVYMCEAMGPSALIRTTRILPHGEAVEGQDVRLHALDDILLT